SARAEERGEVHANADLDRVTDARAPRSPRARREPPYPNRQASRAPRRTRSSRASLGPRDHAAPYTRTALFVASRDRPEARPPRQTRRCRAYADRRAPRPARLGWREKP